MTFSQQAGSSSQPQNDPFQQIPFIYGSSSSAGQEPQYPKTPSPQFDILKWYSHFLSCHEYFLDHAQHSDGVQALAAFMNIQLPYQKTPHPVLSSSTPAPQSNSRVIPPIDLSSHLPQAPHHRFPPHQNTGNASAVSLIPYIRRLIATGHDSLAVLHGFFGDNWLRGIGSLRKIKRRNYLFAAKSTHWAHMKTAYDMSPGETVPFLMPLRDATEEEIIAAENMWSEWLAMQDWMLGPRAPDMSIMQHEPRLKTEPLD